MVGTRSESEKEKTKLRERQRRAITTKIFNGLRKHGGYNLSPRADINQLLRHLAHEAGWHVDPDGTTYRPPKLVNRCPTCGATGSNTSGTTTPTSSSTVMAVQNGAGGFAGEGSTITSPFCIDPTTANNVEPNGTCEFSPYACGGGKDMEIPLGFYMYGGLNHHSTTTATAVHGSNLQLEAMASNHNTPVASPLHPTN